MGDTSDFTTDEEFRLRWNKAVAESDPVRFWIADGKRVRYSSLYFIKKGTVIRSSLPQMADFLRELRLDPKLKVLQWGYTIGSNYTDYTEREWD
jgi:hypothetical protein